MRGQRRVAEEDGDDEPGDAGRKAQQPVDAEQHAEQPWRRPCRPGSGRTPARGGPGTRPGRPAPRCPRPSPKPARSAGSASTGSQPLSASSSSVDDRRGLVARAQHVGRAGVLAAVAARVGQAQRLADDHRERQRAEQVGRTIAISEGSRNSQCLRRQTGGTPPMRQPAILPARSAPAWRRAARRRPAGRCRPGSRAGRR